MATEPQVPDGVAMLVADDIHRDMATGKFFILGTYGTIAAPSFPWTLPALIVYLAFTDGRGQIGMTLRLVDAEETHPPLFASTTVLKFSNPGVFVELALAQPDVILPEPGEYRLQLYTGEDLLRERRLLAWRAPTNGQQT